MQALQTDRLDSVLFHRRVERSHIMIHLAKGGYSQRIVPSNSIGCSYSWEGQRPSSPESDHHHHFSGRFSMRIRSILGALVIASLPVMPAWADMTPEEIKKLVDDAVKQRLEEHERREGAVERREGTTAPSPEPGIGALPEVGRERRTESQPALSFGSSGSGRLVYAKPFVAAPKAIVGGYMDIQYRSQRQSSIENGFNGGISNSFD